MMDAAGFDELVEGLCGEIDDAAQPSQLTPVEALDLYLAVVQHCTTMANALRQDMRRRS